MTIISNLRNRFQILTKKGRFDRLEALQVRDRERLQKLRDDMEDRTLLAGIAMTGSLEGNPFEAEITALQAKVAEREMILAILRASNVGPK